MKEELSPTKIVYEAGKRRKKVKRSGSGNYCCVPSYKSTQYKVDTKAKIKTAIACFFTFQKPQKEKSNGFKAYLDFGEEEGKINSM